MNYNNIYQYFVIKITHLLIKLCLIQVDNL